jgi:hypothetical protein
MDKHFFPPVFCFKSISSMYVNLRSREPFFIHADCGLQRVLEAISRCMPEILRI